MVLAGGASRRLGGRAKGLEEIGSRPGLTGRRIIDHVAAALRPLTQELVIVANDPAAASWLANARVVPDIHPGMGGMAGVHAAVARGRDALVVAWDMPFVTQELLGALLARSREHSADVALPASDSPHGFEPFCAFYSARMAESLDEFLRAGGGAARAFIQKVARLYVMPLTDVRRFGDPQRLFLSVNTSADLARARALATATE